MKTKESTIKHFHKALLAWFKENRRDLPWRYSKKPYHILISEILLQKTDTQKALSAYKRFIKQFPEIESLAAAEPSEIEAIIKDIGLFYRAERLVDLAQALVNEHSGDIPRSKDELLKLKGVGRYAASAIRCFAFNKREAIVDTNIVRLFNRVFSFKSTKKRQREDVELWQFAESLLPSRNIRDYNYALLDFSALVCSAKKPRHEICPLKDICKHYKQKTAKKKTPIGIDLFAGAGGLSLGFEQAGFVIPYAVESDKYAAETYRKNRSSEVLVDVRDICEIQPKEILRHLGLKKGELDIIIGGPPCQGFSTSNMKTRNLDNPKNHLVFKFVEFVKDIKPKWFLMENVAGLDSFENGTIREKLIEIFNSMGYKTECLVLNAANFGVPQNRNRIFFIGNRVGAPMDFIQIIRNTKIKKPVTVFDAISDLPKLANGHSVDVMPYNGRKKKLTGYQKRMRKGMNGRVSNNLVTKNTDLAVERFKHIKQGENLLALARKAPHLVTNYKDVENCHHWIYLRLPWNKQSVTLNNYRKNMLIHPTEDRGLSAREAARLQSFPDKYIFHGSIGFQQQQVANAVPPHVAKKLENMIASSSDKDAFVFVHGYNVTFVDAARRTAQMAYDLKFKGAPIFYSWPSQGKMLEYTVDENNAEWTVPHLKEFLTAIVRETKATKIHLIAHSMGNRALTNTLRMIAAESSNSSHPIFNQLILAAPDIDAEVFKRDIVPGIQKMANHMTLYASSRDEALSASAKLHGYPRAGDVDASVLAILGIDIVDASIVDTSFLGHSYYGDNASIIADISDLLHTGAPLKNRKNLKFEQSTGFWTVELKSGSGE